MLGLNVNTKYGGLNDVLNGAIDNASGSLAAGGSVGAGLSTTVQGLISPYASLLNVVGLGGAFEKTFGSVLANGFDISCWGSSKPPDKIKGILAQHYQPYFQNLLSDVQNGDIQSINRFIKDVYIVNHAAVKMQTATRWSSCSRKGLALYIEFMKPLKDKADLLVNEFIVAGSKKTMQNVSSNFKIGSFTVEGGENLTISYPFLTAPPVPVPVVPIVVEVPKISVNLSDLTPQRTLETITAQLETPINGGELENVNIVGYKAPSKTSTSSSTSGSSSKSSFPWWLVALGIGSL